MINTLIAVHEILERSLRRRPLVLQIGTVPIGLKQKIKRQINK
jgi:hypothetical protein